MSEIFTNKNWGATRRPFMTVITPVYNRRATIRRTMDSVDSQTFRNIEYIVIDDGSLETIDDIVKEFMNFTDLPVMFVKKKNGGVHTARNEGYRNARGELVLCIDSDDELLPTACETFYRAWASIPKEKINEYWQMKAQFVDQNKRSAGLIFPDNINSMDKESARKYFSLAKGDQLGCRVLDIMKKNLFPEPDGVTFVTENIRWVPLEKKYRSWGINDVVAMCHREGDDHLSKSSGKKTEQDIKNLFWNTTFMLNKPKIFMLKFVKRAKMVAKRCVLTRLLFKYNSRSFVNKYKMKGTLNNFLKVLFWLPSVIVANVYYKKKCKKKGN